MFDEGTNAVTINLPEQVDSHPLEVKKQLNVPNIQPKYDDGDENLSNNFIDSELKIFADSLDKKGKHKYARCLFNKFD